MNERTENRIVSHYRILARIGEGAMGIVFKAEDTRLSRLVALKFLPAQLSKESSSAERFLREAQSAAQITHPNVCTIYDIGDDVGSGERFIAMQFIDGVTLRERIKALVADGSTMSISDVISIAQQVASALAAAHSRGIIHRDIKSENIMLDAAGHATVMDFGLARVAEAERLTRTSTLVGTIAYMAPEVIRGEEPDARSDIFSFGVVLYEMLSGRLPFRGAHEAAMMYAIVNEEPLSLVELRNDAPAELHRIVGRALEKDVQKRYQSADELLDDITGLISDRGPLPLHQSASRTSQSVAAVADVVPTQDQEKITSQSNVGHDGVRASRRGPLLRWIAFAAALVLLVVVGLYVFARSHKVALNPAMKSRTISMPLNGLQGLALSADGNNCVFGAPDLNEAFDLYYMNLSEGEPRRITFDSVGLVLFVDMSPDGSTIVYEQWANDSTKGGINVISTLGGRRRQIAKPATGSVPKWRPDGMMIGYMRMGPGGGNIGRALDTTKLEFWTMKPDGSEPRRMFVDDWFGDANQSAMFSWSPDGNSIAWIHTYRDGHQELFVHDLADGTRQQLTTDGKNVTDVAWTRDDHIVITSNRTGHDILWVMPSGGGELTQLTAGNGSDAYPVISADGKRLLYMQWQEISHIWLGSIDSGGAKQITKDTDIKESPALSPDRQRIACTIFSEKGSQSTSHVYVMNRDGTNRRPLTSGDELAAWPAWSPDGRWIAYASRRSDEPNDSSRVYVVEVDNPRKPRLIGNGVNPFWVGADSLILNTARPVDNYTYYFASLSGAHSPVYQRSPDLLWAMPIASSQWLIRDSLRWYIAPSARLDAPGSLEHLRRPLDDIGSVAGLHIAFYRYNCWTVAMIPNGNAIYYCNTPGELRRTLLPQLNVERIGAFPDLTPVGFMNVSYDQKEIVYQSLRATTRLMVLENMW